MYYKTNQIQSYDYAYDLLYNKYENSKVTRNPNENRQDFSEMPVSYEDQIKEKINWINGMIAEIFNNDPRLQNIKNTIIAKFEQYLRTAATKQYKLELLDVVIMKVLNQIKYTLAKSHTDRDIEKVTDSIDPQKSTADIKASASQLNKFIDQLLLAIQQVRVQVPSDESDLLRDKFRYYRNKTGYVDLIYPKLTEEEKKKVDQPEIQEAKIAYDEYIRTYVVPKIVFDTLESEVRVAKQAGNTRYNFGQRYLDPTYKPAIDLIIAHIENRRIIPEEIKQSIEQARADIEPEEQFEILEEQKIKEEVSVQEVQEAEQKLKEELKEEVKLDEEEYKTLTTIEQILDSVMMDMV